jgi:hypothetical protein
LERVKRHVPRLRFRPTTRRDFPECLELVPAWLVLDEHLRRALPDLWLRLLDEPAIITTVMEDLALPAGQRIQGWGWGIVLPESWAEQRGLTGAPASYVTRQIYAGLLDGSLALLSDAQIGVLNAEGRYHFLNFYTQRHNDLSDPYTQSVLTIANEAFRLSASGYKTQAMYFETSERDAPAIIAAGFQQRRYVDESSLQELAPAERPAFMAVTRAEALAGLPGTSVRHVFEHHPPLFRFSASQRRLLWLALFDDSDACLTERLEVSVHGLKKLWRGIYERIEDQMPEFFGEPAGDEEGKRGPEKRRQVLAYVRQRPEELRPWAR